jgi:hypothetical protein
MRGHDDAGFSTSMVLVIPGRTSRIGWLIVALRAPA